MRFIFAGLLALVCMPALADVYGVTITMPPVSGAAMCKPYMGTTAIAGGNKACGTPVVYPGLFPSEATYSITYAGVSAAGVEGARSPATVAVVTKPPATPGAGPTITITCQAGSTAQITVNGVAVPCA